MTCIRMKSLPIDEMHSPFSWFSGTESVSSPPLWMVDLGPNLLCSLHLTTFCLQYSPPIVACVCIHLACKWSNWEIPVSTDGKHWWEYVDNTVTLELLDGKFD